MPISKSLLPTKSARRPLIEPLAWISSNEIYQKTDMRTKLEVENVFRDALSITVPKMSYSFNTIKRLLFFAKMTQPFMRG